MMGGRIWLKAAVVMTVGLCIVPACGNQSSNSGPGNSSSSRSLIASAAGTSTPGAATSSTSSGAASASVDGGPGVVPYTGPNAPYDSGMPVVGQVTTTVQTTLPVLPPLVNVSAQLDDDSASIAFEPVDGALDYRVYPLPADGDITVGAAGAITVHNGTYRCAGTREAAAPMVDNGPAIASDAVTTMVDQQMVGGYLRTLANATLGYVYTQPGPNLVPVYALGESNPYADTTCFFARWAASRTKLYTTSDAERTQMLAALARDDGIAFYVPAAADGTTTTIDVATEGTGADVSRYYYPAGPEAAGHPTGQVAFPVLTAPAAGAVPLMRVFYSNHCGWSHDELAVGQERFNRVYKQGDTQPWWSLLWTGVTGPTTLVVEALDSQCPYQGHFSPQSIGSVSDVLEGTPIVHPAYVTIDQVRAASPTTEVFINGHGAATNLPKAVARSFVNVVPNPHPTMDFYANFSPNSTPETYTTVPCGVPGGNCFQTWRQQSPTFDQMFINVESAPTAGDGLFAYGQVLGEYWVTYADVSSDTNGKFRLTANQKANMDASTFLHVTMEVDAYSTARRYPQILISDQNAPVQYFLDQGHTILVQTFGEVGGTVYWPVDYQIELCKLRTWDVNNQCPVYDLYHIQDANGNTVNLAPNDEVGEHASVDHRVLFDVFASTQRVYLFLDAKPYACANLPAGAAPTGAVTVTWGDVLYHSEVDLTFAYHHAHMQTDQRRHYDNLGFSSGVPAPAWDETRLPCAAPISL